MSEAADKVNEKPETKKLPLFAFRGDGSQEVVFDVPCVFELKPAGEEEPRLAAFGGLFVAVVFFVGLWVDARHRRGPAVIAEGYEGEKGAVALPPRLCPGILGHHSQLHLHRRAKGAVDPTLDDHDVVLVDGGLKLHRVYGGGNADGVGVALRRDGSALVHQIHQPPAHHIAEPVGVVGQNNLGHDAARLADGFLVAHFVLCCGLLFLD